MNPEQTLVVAIFFVLTIYSFVLFKLGMDIGKRRVYKVALEYQKKNHAGEDMGLQTQLEASSKRNANKLFHWGSELLPGIKYYGLSVAGFQVGYHDSKW